MVVNKKETITINEDQFALATVNVIKRLLENEALGDLEKELFKAMCVNFSGELFLELFVEVTDKESNKEE